MNTLNFKKEGEGQPFIFLHGLFGMLDNWKTFARNYSDRYTTWLIDQRDHGKSLRTDEFNYKLLSNDLYRFMVENEIENPILLGHSMGGKVLYQFSQNFPDFADRLIIVDIAPKQYVGDHGPIFEAVNSVDLENSTSRSEIQSKLSEKISDHGILLFLMKNLSRNKEGKGFAWKANFKILEENYQDILSGIDLELEVEKPLLLIKGERSNYIQDSDVEQVQEYYPHLKYRTVPKAGHWVHAENPTSLQDDIDQFLAL